MLAFSFIPPVPSSTLSCPAIIYPLHTDSSTLAMHLLVHYSSSPHPTLVMTPSSWSTSIPSPHFFSLHQSCFCCAPTLSSCPLPPPSKSSDYCQIFCWLLHSICQIIVFHLPFLVLSCLCDLPVWIPHMVLHCFAHLVLPYPWSSLLSGNLKWYGFSWLQMRPLTCPGLNNLIESTIRFNKWFCIFVSFLDACWSEMGLDSMIVIPDEAFLQVLVQRAMCHACCMEQALNLFHFWDKNIFDSPLQVFWSVLDFPPPFWLSC